jgi:hypothetical protein
MAFCNSCGTNIVPGTRFCSKCGAAILTSSLPPAAAAATPATPPPLTPAPSSGGGALKAILIVVGVLVLMGALGVTSVALFAWRVAHRTHIRQEGDNLKVETPFGTVETTKDPEQAARTLGVDLYPGAQVLREGATSATFGTVHTASLNFESSDSLDKICSFYKSRFPNAMVMTADANQCSIVSNDQKNVITVNVKAERDKTRIVISNVTRKSDAGTSSSN